MPVVVETLGEVVERGKIAAAEPIFTAGGDERLAMILYTSGSTGAPKGAMYTERMVTGLWTSTLSAVETPVFNVISCRSSRRRRLHDGQSASCRQGPVSLLPSPTCRRWSTTGQLVRPRDGPWCPGWSTCCPALPKPRGPLSYEGRRPFAAEAQAASELREQAMVGASWRVFGTARWPPRCGIHRAVLGPAQTTWYGLTEFGGVARDGIVMRPPVID